MFTHAEKEDNLQGRHWSETHCDEDVGHFLEGVSTLRKKLEPRGCKVVTSLLLRDPVDQISSEWLYFNGEPGKADTTTAFEWAKRSHENMLRWLVKYQDGGARSDASLWKDAPAPVDIEIADCDQTMTYLDGKFDQIDLVGSMDTPEQFAQWWIALGDMAGFDASLPERDNEAPPEGTSPLAAAAVITEEERQEVAPFNTCSQRARDNAAKRLQAAVAEKRSDPAVRLSGGASSSSVSFDARVDALVARWGGVIPYLDVPSPRHDEMFSAMPFSAPKGISPSNSSQQAGTEERA
eukprot:scaffold97376_cov63-Phaeocystis_antarctica.AAC.3